MALASSCCVIGRPRPRKEPSTERRERSLLPRVIEEPMYCNLQISYYFSLFYVKDYILCVFSGLGEVQKVRACGSTGTACRAPTRAGDGLNEIQMGRVLFVVKKVSRVCGGIGGRCLVAGIFCRGGCVLGPGRGLRWSCGSCGA